VWIRPVWRIRHQGQFIYMSTCPFCQSPISEDLAVYGGHCPSCLIEVPGEEAVTDPGVPHEATGEVAAPSTGGFGLVGLVAVVAVVGGWWFSQQAEPAAAPLQAEGVAKTEVVPLSAHEDAAFEESEVENVVNVEPVSEQRRKKSRQVNVAKTAPTSEPLADALAVSGGSGSGIGMAPMDIFGSIGASPRSRATDSIVLDDPSQIEEMVGRVLNRGAKQLEQCYNQALKLQPGLKGAWYVDFTVTKAGHPAAVSVEALEQSHAEIEACIHRKVEQWRFQKMTQVVDVARRYRFD